jgi:hypothetical protein
MHKWLDILNIVASMVLLYGQGRRYRTVIARVKADADTAIAAWRIEVLRQLAFNSDLRKQKNAAIYREGQARGQLYKLTGRVTRAERLLERVNINNFTRRPPPMPTEGSCAVFLRNHHQFASPRKAEPLLLKAGEEPARVQ